MTTSRRGRVTVGPTRRTRPVRRSTRRLSPVRAAAALAMLASAAGIYGVAASSAFEATELRIVGARYSVAAELQERLAIPAGANLFALATDELEARLLDVPTIARASVTVRLPDTVAVEVAEREPILAWQIGDRRLLVDREGRLFGELPAEPGPEGAALAVVVDHRAESADLGIGSRLEGVDLDAATRLGSLRPLDLGSNAAALSVELTDVEGYLLHARPTGWTAIFGFYTPSLRTPAIIPGQVRLLASLLLERGERNVQRVVLASETDGTFTTAPPASAAPAP